MLNITGKKPLLKLIVLTKTMKLIVVFRYVALYALMLFPKNVSFLNLIKVAFSDCAIVSLQTSIKNIMRITTEIAIKNMKMNVDIFARKFVDSIDDDSSLELILEPLKPIISLKLKSFTNSPTTLSGLTILKLIKPRNWSK